VTSVADLPLSDPGEALRRALRLRMRDWLALTFRHDLLVARAVEGLRADMAVQFDREILRPMIARVGAALPLVRLRLGARDTSDLFPELVALRDDVDRIAVVGAGALREITQRNMVELAEREVRWVAGATARVTGESFAAGIEERAAAIAAGMEERLRSALWMGDTTEQWFDSLLANPVAKNVRSWVSTAVGQGLSVDETVRVLAGTRTQAGILDRSRQAAQGLTRTAMTHATTTARGDSFKALGVGYWRFIATLDLRTTIQCASQDGRIYPVGEGPMPPLHIGCRSVAVPAGSPNEEPIGKRAALGGQVPAETYYEEWLVAQTVAEQNLVLGKTKAEAWRSGKLSLRDMLGRDLQPLTLDELRALDRL
jgi:SPP1 gp7 family putative phage head morphogenesis protein